MKLGHDQTENIVGSTRETVSSRLIAYCLNVQLGPSVEPKEIWRQGKADHPNESVNSQE